jgi:hypothetical protein
MLGSDLAKDMMLNALKAYKVVMEDKNYLAAEDVADALAARDDIDCVIISEFACRSGDGERERVISVIRGADSLVRILFCVKGEQVDRDFQRFCFKLNVTDIFDTKQRRRGENPTVDMPAIVTAIRKGRHKPPEQQPKRPGNFKRSWASNRGIGERPADKPKPSPATAAPDIPAAGQAESAAADTPGETEALLTEKDALIAEKEAALSRAEEALKVTKGEAAELKKEIMKYRDALLKERRENTELKASLQDSARSPDNIAADELADKEREIERLSEDMRQLREETEKLRGERASMDAELSALRGEAAKAAADLGGKAAEIGALETRLAELPGLEAELALAMAELASLKENPQGGAPGAEEQLEESEREILRLTEEIRRAREDAEALRVQGAGMREELSALRGEAAKAAADICGKDAAIRALEARIAGLSGIEAALASAQAELSVLKENPQGGAPEDAAAYPPVILRASKQPNLIVGVFNVTRGAGSSTMAYGLAFEGARRGIPSALIPMDGSGDFKAVKGGKRLMVMENAEGGILTAISAGAKLIVLDFGLLLDLDSGGNPIENSSPKQELFGLLSQCHAVFGMCLSAPWHRQKARYFMQMNPEPVFVADKGWHRNIPDRASLTPEVILDSFFPVAKEAAKNTSSPGRERKVRA